MTCARDAHIGDYSSVALNDVWTVMTLQHNVQIHEDPLILVFITRPSHLLLRNIIA